MLTHGAQNMGHNTLRTIVGCYTHGLLQIVEAPHIVGRIARLDDAIAHEYNRLIRLKRVRCLGIGHALDHALRLPAEQRYPAELAALEELSPA